MDEASKGDGETTSADELDRLFGEIVAAVSEGRDVGTFVVDHPGQATKVASMIALARQVAVRSPLAVPELPGFTFLEELGRGGMGSVWLARQDRLDRLVALKTMSGRLVTGARARARFEREVRAVARLDHPNIVSVYEAGETDGTPWFTMDYVPGRSMADVLTLVRASERDPASLRGADLAAATRGAVDDAVPEPWRGSWAECAARICVDLALALDHAHGQGVVHRDVKPSNVLLRRDGRTLLFDFGIARTEAEEVLTLTGDFVGSPCYVAPEQAHPGRGPIDARTDVWSLGVTLYEMLTLRVPFDGVNSPDILRRISEEEPPPPRRTSRRVPRDLEVICLTALQKDPARRYSSAAAFAHDLQRFLAREPIHARPTGAGTRVLRWVQRNVTLSIALALGAAIVIGAPIAWAIHESRLLDQERRAGDALRVQIDRLEAVNGFQEGLFGAVSPGRSGRDVRVVDILAPAREAVAGTLERSPEVGLEISNFVVGAYSELGLTVDALALAERAFAVVEGLGDAIEPPLRRKTTLRLARALLEGGQASRALTLVEGLHREVTALGGEAALEALHVTPLLARALAANDRIEEADRIVRARLALEGRLHGEESWPARSARRALAHHLMNAGEWAEAVEVLARLEREIAASSGEGDRSLLELRLSLATARAVLGDTEGALAIYERSVPVVEQTHGPDSITTFRHLNELGVLLMRAGRLADAEALFRDLCDRARQELGVADPQTHKFLGHLGGCLAAAGRPEEACELLAEAVAGVRGRGLGETREGLALRGNYAMARSDVGRHDEAVAEMEAVVRGWRELVGEHERTAEAEAFLGAALDRAGRHEDAWACIDGAERMAHRLGDEFSALRFRVLRGFVETNMGRLADAEATLLACVAGFDERGVEASHPERRRAGRGLADVYDLLERPEEAVRWREGTR